MSWPSLRRLRAIPLILPPGYWEYPNSTRRLTANGPLPSESRLSSKSIAALVLGLSMVLSPGCGALFSGRMSAGWNETTPLKLTPPYQVGDYVKVAAGRNPGSDGYSRGRIDDIQGDKYFVATHNYGTGYRSVLDTWKVGADRIYDENVAKKAAERRKRANEMQEHIWSQRDLAKALQNACSITACKPTMATGWVTSPDDLVLTAKGLARVDELCRTRFADPPQDANDDIGGAYTTWCALASRRQQIVTDHAQRKATERLERATRVEPPADAKVEEVDDCEAGKYLTVHLGSKEEQREDIANVTKEVKAWYAAAGLAVPGSVTEAIAQVPTKRQAGVLALKERLPVTGKCPSDSFCKKWAAEFHEDDFRETVTAFGDSDWEITTHPNGVPEEKIRYCRKLLKGPNGLCKWVGFGVNAPYQGGGRYAAPRLDFRTVTAMGLARCE